MTDITAGMVKDLREKTGAGMMDCKTALQETKGDMEAAIDWLRAKGLSKAAKKAGRVAAEGLVGIAAAEGKGAVVEVNSETDFVARNDAFQDLVAQIAKLSLDVGGDVEALKAMSYPGTGNSVSAQITSLVATVGENMSLRRCAVLTANPGVVSTYVHNQVKPGLGKIGVLVALKSTGDKTKLDAFGRQVAMHVAAVNPLALTPEQVDADIVARERAIFVEQAKASGKPDAVVQKMVEGRIRKFYEEVVLLSQAFIVNPDLTVQAAVEATAKELGASVEITGFVRFGLGDGIQKEESDFAAEVQKAAQG
jgi:elongation factor Ts